MQIVSVIGMIVGVAVLIYLTFKGLNGFVASLIGSIIVIITSGLPFWGTLTGSYAASLVSRNRIRVKERDGKSETGKGRESQSYQGKQRTSMRRPPRRGRALSSSTRTAARGSSGGFLYS